jgi:hypothetical protein
VSEVYPRSLGGNGVKREVLQRLLDQLLLFDGAVKLTGMDQVELLGKYSVFACIVNHELEIRWDAGDLLVCFLAASFDFGGTRLVE